MTEKDAFKLEADSTNIEVCEVSDACLWSTVLSKHVASRLALENWFIEIGLAGNPIADQYTAAWFADNDHASCEAVIGLLDILKDLHVNVNASHFEEYQTSSPIRHIPGPVEFAGNDECGHFDAVINQGYAAFFNRLADPNGLSAYFDLVKSFEGRRRFFDILQSSPEYEGLGAEKYMRVARTNRTTVPCNCNKVIRTTLVQYFDPRRFGGDSIMVERVHGIVGKNVKGIVVARSSNEGYLLLGPGVEINSSANISSSGNISASHGWLLTGGRFALAPGFWKIAVDIVSGLGAAVILDIASNFGHTKHLEFTFTEHLICTVMFQVSDLHSGFEVRLFIPGESAELSINKIVILST